MIKRKTTFIVGAGASNDLGLPVGPQLQTIVHDLLGDQSSVSGNAFWGSVRLALSNDSDRFERILARASEFRLRMLSAASIDNFLDQHRDDTDMVITLKCAIVYAIAEYERNSRIGCGITDLDELVRRNHQYFLFDLMNLVVRGHQLENIGQSLSNLSFITFNYDRCIERYIEQWLIYRFGDNAGSLARLVNVLHVYGSIDRYFESDFENPFLRRGNTPYGNCPEVIPKLAQRIKLFTEQEDSQIPGQILETLRDTAVVGFLGFGFEEQNMRFFPQGYRDKDVFATAFGLSNDNTEFLKGRLTQFSTLKRSVYITNGKCKDLFRDFYMPLVSAIGTV